MPPSTASLRRPSVVAVAAAAVASFAIIGADSRWLVALGATFAHSLPFASAPTSGWHDVPVLAQSVFAGLYDLFGERGLVLAQMAAAAAAFVVLARGVRSDVVLLVVLIGTLAQLLVVHAELFSLVLFPALLLLLERAPERLWLAVPLLALWSNLHGSALVGLALLVVYVAIADRRRWPVAIAAAVGLCVTPALWHTPQYYWGVAQNEAARRGVGLWAPLGLRPLDVVLALCAVALAGVGRRRFSRWEAVAAVGLALATLHSARLGVWLLFLLAYPASRALPDRRYPVLFALPFALLAILGLAHTPFDAGSRTLAKRAAATHAAVLAEPILAEEVELYGGRVWVADPIDAFRARDQSLYLDWLDGRAPRAVRNARYVLVRHASRAGRAAASDPRLSKIGEDNGFVLYRRR
ncbi:MAG TPA: hypothetical protein VI408_16775 [Gaiellaceae bacterium]